MNVEKLLRYLIPIILMTIAVTGYTNKADSLSHNRLTTASNIEIMTYDFYSASESDFFVQPHQTTSPAFRPQNTAKRTNNAPKHTPEFVKLGKIINTAVINLNQKKSLTTHSSFIKPYHRMICLGKLII